MVCKYYGQRAKTAVFNAFISNDPLNQTIMAGPNIFCNPNEVALLTSNWNGIVTAINGLRIGGGTNIFSGFMWGWRLISPNGPFRNVNGLTVPRDPKPYGYTDPSITARNNKVIILLTDGMNGWNTYANTNNSFYMPFGYIWNNRLGPTTAANARNLIDAATIQACTNAKAAGVTIYTVAFSVAGGAVDAKGQAILQACATDASHYFLAANADQLTAAFKSITQSLTPLRLSN